MLEYHTFLHHSQTFPKSYNRFNRLSTIHFYIILKLGGRLVINYLRLSTIHFYIILKLLGTKFDCINA